MSLSGDGGTPVPTTLPEPVEVEDTTPKEPVVVTITGGGGTFVRPAEV